MIKPVNKKYKPKILLLSRNLRFQKTTEIIKKNLPKTWNILELTDNCIPKNHDIKKGKNNSLSLLKIEKKLCVSASKAAENYILYYDYYRQLNLEPSIVS